MLVVFGWLSLHDARTSEWLHFPFCTYFDVAGVFLGLSGYICQVSTVSVVNAFMGEMNLSVGMRAAVSPVSCVALQGGSALAANRALHCPGYRSQWEC